MCKGLVHNIKIAVCLTGIWRHWDLCRTNILYLTKRFPDIEFDFFAVTWDKSNYDFERYPTVEITPEHFVSDFEGYNLVDYEIYPFEHLDEGNRSFSIEEHGCYRDKRSALAMSFMKRKVGILKSRNELKNGFVYDYILGIRPDLLLSEQTYSSIQEYIDWDITTYSDASIITRDTNIVYKFHVALDHAIICEWEHGYGLISGDELIITNSPSYDNYTNMYEMYYAYRDNYNHVLHMPKSMDVNAIESVGLRQTEMMMYVRICRNNLREYKNEMSDPRWVDRNINLISDSEVDYRY